jgi:hypothetical protein
MSGGLRGLVGLLVCLAVLMVAVSAAGASGWVVQSVPAPTVLAGQLTAVSCPSASWCMAVGSGPNGGFAERWDGASWAVESLPEASVAALGGISCSSPRACTAVGAVGAGTKAMVVAERWDGTRWAVQPAPRGSVAGESLGGVSCPTRRFCVAVGSSVNQPRSKGLVELWKGSRWTIKRTRIKGVPARAHDSLTAVSCVSAEACVAVGAGITGTWNGSRWSLRALKHNRGVVLDAVSCRSVKACVAVGAGAYHPYWARWNGRRWAVHRMPDFGAQLGGFPNSGTIPSISCTSAMACIAVGGYSGDNSPGGSLAVRLRGDRWSLESLPTSASGGADLEGVSCTAGDCTAVGDALPNSEAFTAPPYTLAVHWNGRTWSTEQTPSQLTATFAEFDGVSCASPSACTAVGFYDAENGEGPFAEGWNGSTWSIQSTPAPSGIEAESQLSGVSCTSASACIAVGSVNFDDGQVALRWDGTRWVRLSTAGPAYGELSAVSCTSADACTAVGDAPSPDGFATDPVAERWNGTTWIAQNVPSPASGRDAYALLTAVSCSGPTACTAVGRYQTTSNLVQFAESWDGIRWSLQTMPASTALPTSVSCTSASACVAVSGVNGVNGPAAERWNGSAWTMQTLPPSPPIQSGGLYGVSCATASQCTAVGFFGPSLPGIIDVWDGTVWTAQSPPTMPGLPGVDLSAVSCTSADACTAVGNTGNAGGAIGGLLAIRST